MDTATVSFTTAGEVLAGGKILIESPDLNAGTALQTGWAFDNPVIAFTTPAGTPSATGAFATRTLTITTSAATMAQETAHVFTITNTITPSSIVAANNVAVTTQDSKNKVVDGPTNCATDQI